MASSSSSSRNTSRSTPATRSRTRTGQTIPTISISNSTSSPSVTNANPTTTTSSQRKPFSPLPLGLFPCKFDLHSGFSLRSTACSPQITSTSTSTSIIKSPSVSASTSTSASVSERMGKCVKSKAVPASSSSSSTRKEGSKKVVPTAGPDLLHATQVNKKQSTRNKSARNEIQRMEVDGDLTPKRAGTINLDSDDEEEAAWEQQSPARRLFVGMGMGMMGSASPSSSSMKPNQPRSKLSMMMMDDDPDTSITASASTSTSTMTTMPTIPATRPTLRPSPKLTPKKTSTSAISINEKRTWTGRDSPSASPIMSKKFRPVGSTPVAATDVEMNGQDGLEHGDEDGDRTIMPVEMDPNADVHAVGFEVWSDQAVNGASSRVVRRDQGYFDLGDEVVRPITPVATPKYTAENIKHVGKNKVPFPTGTTSTDEADQEAADKGQENVPPLGWIDLAALAGEKLKTVCKTPTREKFADQFATPGSGSSCRRGTPSYGDPSSVSSLASTPATDRVRRTSTVSLAPSPVKASSVRGPTSSTTSSSTLTLASPPPTPPSESLSSSSSSNSAQIPESEAELPTPTSRTRLGRGRGMKKSLTKSLADLRDAAGLGGRVLRSGRGRDL